MLSGSRPNLNASCRTCARNFFIPSMVVALVMIVSAQRAAKAWPRGEPPRSEEHTSELQSQFHLVCRHLLEKKKSLIKHLRRPLTTLLYGVTAPFSSSKGSVLLPSSCRIDGSVCRRGISDHSGGRDWLS